VLPAVAAAAGHAGHSTPVPVVEQGQKLTASDESGAGEFGESTALSADGATALIGGPQDNGSVGAAWAFTRSGSSWTQQGSKLTASDESGHAGLGWSVALSADGNTALIGAPFDHGSIGAAWVFTRAGSTWTQQGPKLTAGDETGPGEFGESVALSADGNTAVIGGPNDGCLTCGAAWVFTRSGGTWAQQGPKLTPNDEVSTGSDVGVRGGFGASVALAGDGNTALVGDPNNKSFLGVSASAPGAAWVFTRSGSGWAQNGPGFTGNDNFSMGTLPQQFGLGAALSSDGQTALIDGDGVASVFTASASGFTQQGSDLAGTGGVALSGDGDTALIGGSIFARSASTWSQTATATPSGEVGSSGFGTSAALSSDGTHALIGGPIDNGDGGAAWAFASPSTVLGVTASDVSLTGVTAGRPRLRFQLTAAPSAPQIRSFTLTLPGSLGFAHRRAEVAKGVDIKGASKYTLKLVHGRLTVGLARPSGAVSVAIRPPALTSRARKKALVVRLRLDVTDAAHQVTKLTLSVKPR
jgi:hypothetical protein